jgi:hypothetical protein
LKLSCCVWFAEAAEVAAGGAAGVAGRACAMHDNAENNVAQTSTANDRQKKFLRMGEQTDGCGER